MNYLEEITRKIKTDAINNFYFYGYNIGESAAKSIAEALELNNSITILNFDGNHIGSGGAEKIAEALKTNQSVTTLNLCGNNIGDDGAKYIAEVLRSNLYITTLDLSSNHISSVGAKYIAEALKINQSVTTLVLDDNDLGNDGAMYIAEALKINESITMLSLDSIQIKNYGVKQIADALKKNESITSLNLSNNQLIDLEMTDLTEALKINKSITTLYLNHNQISNPGVKYIAAANQTITILSLVDNFIGEYGVKDVAEAMKFNYSISFLDLSDNKIGCKGAKHIADVLEINQSITTLYVSNCEIGDSGVHDIAIALQNNHSLIELNLSNNGITDKGVNDLAQALRFNKSVTTLNLSRNNIGNDGANDLSEALKVNESITTVNLEFNSISYPGLRYIVEAIKTNVSICTFHLVGNDITDADANKCEEETLRDRKELAVKARLDDLKKQALERAKESNFANFVDAVDGESKFDEDDQATIREISYLIREGNDRLQEHFEKGILLLGMTGAGKSTLAHLLSGRKLQAILDDETNELVIDALQPIEDIVIGHKLASETRIPNKSVLADLTIWDCPGFNDTNHVQEIANKFYIKRLFETTDKLIFILVVPELALNSANARGSMFIETLSFFIKSFNDVEFIKDSISLVVTHVTSNKNINHIKKLMDKILTDNQGATNKQRALINTLFEKGSIHLFYKPRGEGELALPNLLEPIAESTKYSNVSTEMSNIAISKKAMDISLHLLTTVSDKFNELIQVIVKAIADSYSNFRQINPFCKSHAVVKNWIPTSIRYNDHLRNHYETEYFLDLDLLLKLQNVFTCDQIQGVFDAVTIMQQAVETLSEYDKPGDILKQRQILNCGYCLQQQHEYLKFFSKVCKVELYYYTKFSELIKICHRMLKEMLEFRVSNLHINQNQSDLGYYMKAIGYLDMYPDNYFCLKIKAVAYSCMASIAEKNSDQESQLLYCAKAIGAHIRLPKIYEKLGQIFFSRGQYAKAIACYKVVNNEFEIEACFKSWLEQDQGNPDIMLQQAEYFESIGLFEQAKRYYYHAFSKCQDENSKASALRKIGNIMVANANQGQDLITRANNYDLYNFRLVNTKFMKNLLA